MKFRKTIQNQVKEKLDCSYFTAEDFIIEFNDSQDHENIMKITFAHNKAFIFYVSEDDAGFEALMKPGKISEEDWERYNTLTPLLNSITKWANEIRFELKAEGPIYDQVEKLKQHIRQHINTDSDSDEFTVDEINSLKHKFKELEKRVINLEKDKIITSTQLETFQKGVQQVSTDIEYYPKKTWLQTAPNKLINIIVSIGKSTEGRKILADGARKLLGLE